MATIKFKFDNETLMDYADIEWHGDLRMVLEVDTNTDFTPAMESDEEGCKVKGDVAWLWIKCTDDEGFNVRYSTAKSVDIAPWLIAALNNLEATHAGIRMDGEVDLTNHDTAKRIAAYIAPRIIDTQIKPIAAQ